METVTTAAAAAAATGALGHLGPLPRADWGLWERMVLT